MKKTLLALAAVSLAMPVSLDPKDAASARTTTRHYYTASNGVRYWQGSNGRYYCHRSNGTVGLLVGGAGGALVGRAIDTHGSHTTGMILGATAGALLGRHIAREQVHCR